VFISDASSSLSLISDENTAAFLSSGLWELPVASAGCSNQSECVHGDSEQLEMTFLSVEMSETLQNSSVFSLGQHSWNGVKANSSCRWHSEEERAVMRKLSVPPGTATLLHSCVFMSCCCICFHLLGSDLYSKLTVSVGKGRSEHAAPYVPLTEAAALFICTNDPKGTEMTENLVH